MVGVGVVHCDAEPAFNTSRLSGTTTPAEHGLVPPPGVLPKTVISSKLRLIFTVGLEGTGHHYMVDALVHLFRENKDLRYFNLCPIARELYLFNAMKKDPAYYWTSQEKIRTEMRQLAAAQRELSELGTIATLQPTDPSSQPGCKGIGVMSYPFNVGRDKVLKYPDLRTVAEAAEAEGIDLRIIYLKRSAEDLLVANTVHRDFPS